VNQYSESVRNGRQSAPLAPPPGGSGATQTAGGTSGSGGSGSGETGMTGQEQPPGRQLAQPLLPPTGNAREPGDSYTPAAQ